MCACFVFVSAEAPEHSPLIPLHNMRVSFPVQRGARMVHSLKFRGR